MQKEDERFLALPLEMGPNPRSMAAHLRQTVKLLQGPGASSAAVAHLTGLYARTVKPHPDIACSKGCAFCCSQDVSVSLPEAFTVAAAVSRDPRLVEAVLETDTKLRTLSPKERLGKILCPLLTDKICSIYAARPIACHAFVSVSLPACLAAFVEHKPPEIPQPADDIQVMYSVRILMLAALRLLGLNDQTYEMTPAVAAILRQPDAERRWFAGEEVFKDVTPNPPIPPQFNAGINGMVAHVAPTL